MISRWPVGSPVLTGPQPSSPWQRWLSNLVVAVNATSSVVGTASVSAQGAAISATAVSIPAVQDGLYRVSHYLRVTRAATTSSSANVTYGWTDGAVACALAFTAVTGNTTATIQTGTALVRVDRDTSLTYTVSYASVGATSMQYALDVVVEAVPS